MMKKTGISKTQRVIVASVLVGLSFVLLKVMGYVPVTIIIMIASTLVAGTPVFRKAFSALRYKIVGIDALVTIAVVGAMIIGEYWEAAAVTYLFMFGDYLESRTIEKTRSSIKSLLALAPTMARVRRNGSEFEVDPDEVSKGETVVIKPGERIPVDGTVIEGEGYVNQASITGESLPVGRRIDEMVYSGTVIESGYLIVRADKVGDDTTFARILQLVEEAQDKKARTQKLLEKFSRFYTPAIIVLAVLFYLINRDIVLALTLLVIACPGALVISAPVSIVAGIGNGARHGVLIKGGDIMEKMGRIRAIAFDKTGTLTVGKPRLRKITAFGIEGIDENELLRLAAIGESYSEHPLGKAIIAEATKRLGAIGTKPEDAEMIPGQGLVFFIEGSTGGRRYLIGNRRLFEENGIDIQQHEPYLIEEEALGRTTVMLGNDEAVLGIMSIADVVREGVKELILRLRRLGIRHMVMLTGDNERTAAAIADELGLDSYYGELMPEDKVESITRLQARYGATAMVGDGVNDAPALAATDLGIAIGGAGTDVAMEAADVVLMSEDVSRLSYAVGLSRATVRNMKQNIYFALLVAGILLAGVLFKNVNLSLGMLVHELSVLIVIINAMRLLRYRERGSINIGGVQHDSPVDEYAPEYMPE
jgi:Cd2+/Zn2+-exporting ATPase